MLAEACIIHDVTLREYEYTERGRFYNYIVLILLIFYIIYLSSPMVTGKKGIYYCFKYSIWTTSVNILTFWRMNCLEFLWGARDQAHACNSEHHIHLPPCSWAVQDSFSILELGIRERGENYYSFPIEVGLHSTCILWSYMYLGYLKDLFINLKQLLDPNFLIISLVLVWVTYISKKLFSSIKMYIV